MDKIASTANRVSRIKSHLRYAPTRIAFPSLPAAPESSLSKLAAVDSAYNEYCDLLESGVSVDTRAFCENHANCRSELYRRIEVHQYLDENPAALDCLEPIPWPQIGDEFGDCRLVEELGRGGVGRVYLAQEKELPRCVVLKLAAVNTGEAERISRLNHPNIVPIYYVRRDAVSGLTAICMPFESRYTLVDVLDEAFQSGSLPERLDIVCRKLFSDEHLEISSPGRGGYVADVLRIGRDLADALAHSHDKGIYHLDLKPSNVIIKHDGAPLLIDFNMSIDDANRGDFLGGTKPYMSPEQVHRSRLSIAAGTEELNGKSDVFSLAIILCQLLTGTHPFGEVAWNGTAQKLLHRQQQWSASELAKFSYLDRRIVALLAKCLEYDARERPTARALSAQIENLVFRRRQAPNRRKLLTATLLTGSGLLLGAVLLMPRELNHIGFYRAGLVHVAAGRFDDAITSFTRSIDVNPKFAPAWVARARTRECRAANGDLIAAIDDYENAYQLTPDPALKAGIGYCDARLMNLPVAAAHLRAAIEGGFATAEVFNNLGYCETNLTYFAEARANLSKALSLNPRLQAASYNRALNELKQSALHGDPIAAVAKTDIEQALQTGNVDSRLLYYAALIWDRLPDDDSQRRKGRILDLLDQALDLGLDANLVSGNAAFVDFTQDPDFRIILDKSRTPRPAPPVSRLVRSVDWRRSVVADLK